ncbi:hypothetical protein [Stenotrophomonas sp.]|uniref:hypothetical protein n=1 Tax=Stenotrophomonas sp. TaxID=69392 RepID=UPI00289937BB|nr:hypothetical protein [Stenotrophomonas sp.]
MKPPLQRLGLVVVLVGAAVAGYGFYILGPFQDFTGCLQHGGRGACPPIRWGVGLVLAGIAMMLLLGPLGTWILHGRTKR